MSLKPGEKILVLERIRYMDDEPVIIELNKFPESFSFLFGEDLNDTSFISRSEGSSNAILIVFAPAVAFIIRHISVKLMTSVILRWSFFSATKVPFPDLRSRYPNSDNSASAFRTVILYMGGCLWN